MRIQGAGNSQSSSSEPIVISGGNGDDRIHVTNNEMGGVDVKVTNFLNHELILTSHYHLSYY